MLKSAPNDAAPKLPTGVRWTVCALIFFATTVNYLDRQLFSQLVPFFEDDLKLGPTDLALINVSFILPYGFSMIFIGRLLDKVGIKKGLSVAFIVWNIASIAHSLIRSLAGFMGIRFLLGLGEAAMYPGGVKTITEWFPRRERALATGYFNAGANMGALIAPLLGVAMATLFGWRTCFLITGGIGVVWIFFWKKYYEAPNEHPKISPEELAYIQGDKDQVQNPLTIRQIFGMRPVIGLGIAKALSDAPWWFYLTWMPKFLTDQFHLTAGFMAIAVAIIYIVADLGSIAGGWLSSNLINRGYSVGSARKIAMFICALAVLPVMATGSLVGHADIGGIPTVYIAITIISIAAGAHQGWSSNLFTLISDTVPKPAIGMAVGAINGCAMIGVSALQFFVGRSVQLTSSYTLSFIVAGSLYLVALVFIHLFMPKVEQSTSFKPASPWAIGAGTLFIIASLCYLQFQANHPPYANFDEYLTVRASEIKAQPNPEKGPTAMVGWMSAQWYRWHLLDGKTKVELVKTDTHDHPFVESKGVKAARYKGPDEVAIKAAFPNINF